MVPMFSEISILLSNLGFETWSSLIWSSLIQIQGQTESTKKLSVSSSMKLGLQSIALCLTLFSSLWLSKSGPPLCLEITFLLP